MNTNEMTAKKIRKIIIVSVMSVILILVIGMIGFPLYNVWQKGLEGEANLKKAEQEKLIQITQAKAELESSQYRAKAIETIGEMAKKFPEYRQQEFIGAFAEALKEGTIQQIIYVPTETNIPILENSRQIKEALK